MPHPEGDTSPPDQWDDSDELAEDTAREVTPWTTMTGKNAPRNFRPVPIPSDTPVEVPVESIPKDSSALESVTSSQESDNSSSEQMTSQTPATPARKLATKASGQSKENATSSQSSSKDQNPG